MAVLHRNIRRFALRGFGDIYTAGGDPYAAGGPQSVPYTEPTVASPVLPLAIIGAAVAATVGAVYWFVRR